MESVCWEMEREEWNEREDGMIHSEFEKGKEAGDSGVVGVRGLGRNKWMNQKGKFILFLYARVPHVFWRGFVLCWRLGKRKQTLQIHAGAPSTNSHFPLYFRTWLGFLIASGVTFKTLIRDPSSGSLEPRYGSSSPSPACLRKRITWIGRKLGKYCVELNGSDWRNGKLNYFNIII